MRGRTVGKRHALQLVLAIEQALVGCDAVLADVLIAAGRSRRLLAAVDTLRRGRAAARLADQQDQDDDDDQRRPAAERDRTDALRQTAAAPHAAEVRARS